MEQFTSNGRKQSADQSSALTEFSRSLVYSALQGPINGVGELAKDCVSENVGWKLELVAPPDKQKFGSSAWMGQQAGTAIGMIVPLTISNSLTKGACRFAGKTSGLAESKVVLDTLSKTSGINAANIGRQALTGFTNDFMFTENHSQRSTLTGHLQNGISGALTFGSLSAFNVGLTSMSKAHWGETAPWMVHATKTDIARHVIAGAGAGTVSSVSHAYMDGRPATTADVVEGAATFAMLGGVMRLRQESVYRNSTKSLADSVAESPRLQEQARADEVAGRIVKEHGQLRVKPEAEIEVQKAGFFGLLQTANSPSLRLFNRMSEGLPVMRIKDGSYHPSAGISFIEGSKSIKVSGTGLAISTGSPIEATGSAIVQSTGGNVVARDGASVVAIDASVTLSGHSSVRALGSSKISAGDNSEVYARHQALVQAEGDAWVVAREQANVELKGESHCVAFGESKVTLNDKSSSVLSDQSAAYVFDQAHVQAVDRSLVWLKDKSTGSLFDDSQAFLFGESKVEAYDRSVVEANDRAQVHARNRSQVEAWQDASVTASPGVKATIHEDAKLVTEK